MVRGEIRLSLETHEQRAIGCGRAFPRRGACTAELDVGERALLRDATRDGFCHRTATGIARAHEKYSQRRHKSPIKSDTDSRRVADEIAPGRITRGRRPIQSTTVDAAEGTRRPPSSTRSTPRPIASDH